MLKLKPIVASLMMLGLAAPAFADDPSAATQAQLDSMKAQLAKMETIINQNNTGGFYQANDWTNRITISGLINADAAYANKTPVFGYGAIAPKPNDDVTNLSVNNANLLVDALVNDWTKVHIGLFYSANTSDAFTPCASYYGTRPTFDEGYVTIANFSENPFFFRAGREYVPFGVYDRYPIVVNPTQALTQTQATAAQVGFVAPIGFYGSVYALRGLPKNGDRGTSTTGVAVIHPKVNNLGADLGYAYADSMYNAKVDVGYLSNMDDVTYISQNLSSYANRTSGITVSADGSAWNFDGSVRYVATLQSFSRTSVTTVNGTGAKPQAIGGELGYNFPVIAHQTRFALGYQHTHDSATRVLAGVGGGVGGFGLPQDRYYGMYTVNVSKWTDIGLEVYHDRDYSTGSGGTGRDATAGVLRLGVKFA